MPGADAGVTDATDGNFETEVIERSRRVPVVVDFWAPWCVPCKVVGEALEHLVEESQGAWVLVKVDIDSCPDVTENLGIKSIPSVLAFVDGRQEAEFIGSRPVPEIAGWLGDVVARAGEGRS